MPTARTRLSDTLRGRWRRTLPWAALIPLLAVAQGLLLMLTLSYESSRAQDQAEAVALEAAAEVKRQVTRALQDCQVSSRAGREGFETLFVRRDGERIPVMIYEAPLVDGSGRPRAG